MSALGRLFSWGNAFEHPVTVGIVAAVSGVLVLAPLLILVVNKLARPEAKLKRELWLRYLSWVVLAPAIALPILAGPGWTVVAVTALGLLCYAEFARATGLFREKLLSAIVVLGILAVNFAALDNWYAFFVALFPLCVGAIAVGTIFLDRPKGYIQRVALALLGFTLFGAALAHLSMFAHDANYRPILLLLFFAVELNDIFAFCVGKPLGRHKLAPNTSPGKTVEGSIGALILTTMLTAVLGHFVFKGTALDAWPLLILLGVTISVLGQLGDLTLSSIKRDLGIKDMASTIPGHGGVLDRFNSMLLVAPAVFHLANYVLPAVAHGQPQRVITGG
ncbi:MAG: phosphatidate cytidylyltransferase [Planctomycetes bacterium]|nr:phosphatidate cytidylyltransferase [Planctomycetota bacterium]